MYACVREKVPQESRDCDRQLKMTGGGAAFGEILLVVFFGTVEGACGLHFGNDGAIEDVRFFERGDGFAGFGFLFGIVIENGGAILRAEIGSLAIERGGIVILK